MRYAALGAIIVVLTIWAGAFFWEHVLLVYAAGLLALGILLTAIPSPPTGAQLADRFIARCRGDAEEARRISAAMRRAVTPNPLRRNSSAAKVRIPKKTDE